MKSILLPICLIMTCNIYGQIAPLEDYTWYLEKVVIDGSTTNTPEGYIVTSEFWDSMNFLYQGCADFYGLVNYTSNQNFSINNGSAGMQICLNPLDPFDELYIEYFIQFDTYVNPYSYTFTNQGNLIILTITNANGDQAIYRNQSLSIGGNNGLSEISIYPNPAEEYFILNPKINEMENIVVYDLSGKKIKTFLAQEKYSISDLASGVYFVKINGNGHQNLLKLVKE